MIRFTKFFASMVLLLSALTAVAQKKVITEKEFNAAWRSACEKTSRAPHVHTETSEEYSDDTKPPYSSYISVTRYLPPDRVWTIAGRQGAKAEDKYEAIRIGQKSYSRDGTGAWKFQELGFSGLYYCEPEKSSNSGTGYGSGSSGGSETMKFEHEYQYQGREEAGAEIAEIYVHIKRMIITGVGGKSRTIFKHTYWLNKNGAFLKSEYTTRNAASPRWSRQLREYHYDQKDFKIEAPIK